MWIGSIRVLVVWPSAAQSQLLRRRWHDTQIVPGPNWGIERSGEIS
jgi:hypothetical protein